MSRFEPSLVSPRIHVAPFGATPEGVETRLFRLNNRHGVQVEIGDLGATVVALRAPDRHGHLADIVLGCTSAPDYLRQGAYLGALIGRYANRIGGARFRLDGREVALTANEGANHLHGGAVGFDKRRWTAEPLARESSAALRLSLVSADGEEGYPGTLEVSVTYALGDDNALSVDYEATTDRPTVVNLTQHSYFNLGGHAAGDIGAHVLTLAASHYLPVGADLIPTGEIASVAGTPLDFRRPKPIGRDIDADFVQLRRAGGYDHTFVLDRPASAPPALAAVVEHPESGRVLTVLTDHPGVQLYAGGGLDGRIVGKNGVRYGRRHGFCLETQHFPDSPNRPHFPSSVLRPGETYRQRTIFRFATL